MADKPQTADEKLQHEFNGWAAAGEGAKMERHHLDITEKTIRLMNLRPGERVLDLGCGSGWATRLLARLVGEGPEGFGQVVGLDVSDEMVRQAREASKDFENILYVWGSALQIPWEENFFDKVLSVESFYYYPDQDRALMELFRVMAPRGTAFYSDQSLQRQPLFAAMGRQAQGAGPRPVRRRIRRTLEEARLRRRTSPPHSRRHADAGRLPNQVVQQSGRSAGIQTRGRALAHGVEARSAHAASRVHDLLIAAALPRLCHHLRCDGSSL